MAGHTDILDSYDQKIHADYAWQVDEDIIQINKEINDELEK